MDTVFDVLAERNRREILRLLVQSEQSVGDLESQLNRPQPTISKHLRVLREAGLVESRTEAQKRVYRLRPQPLLELDEWLEPFRRLWTERLDTHQMPDVPKKKRSKR